MTPIVDSQAEPQNTDRIAGWLAIPAYGLILGLALEGMETWSLTRTFMRQPTVETAIVLATVVSWILFCVVVAAFLFRRHRWAPYLFIVLLIGNLMLGSVYLAQASSVDEMEINFVPTLLGSGARLFEGVGDDLHDLELVRTVAAPKVTHLKFARA